MGLIIRTLMRLCWDNFRKNADKFKVLGFTKQKYPYALIRSFFGKINVAPVATIGVDPNNSNEVLVLNLKNCPIELSALSDEEILSKMVKSPKPILTIRANAMPSVWSFPDYPELADYTHHDMSSLQS